jgi:hypothetical protein
MKGVSMTAKKTICLIVFVTLFSALFFASNQVSEAAYPNGYSYCRVMTMNASVIATTTTSGFALVATSTLPSLAVVGSGGRIELTSSASGTTTPTDVVVTDSTDCDTPGTTIDFFFEKYVSTTGEFVLWLEAPDVSSTTNKTVTMYYGNSGASDVSDETGVFGALNEEAVWNFSENPAGTAPQMKDSTANGHDGTSTGSMTSDDQIPGQLDGSLDFDGGDDVIEVTQDNDFDISSGPFTIGAYLGDDSPGSALSGAYHRAISWYDGTNNIQLGLGESGANLRQYYVLNLPGNGAEQAATAGDAPTGMNHVVATFDGSSYTIYMNGVEAGGGNLDLNVGTFTGNSTILYIGERGNGAFFEGRMDDIRIHKRALTAADILTIYNNTSDSETFWTFGAEEESGSASTGPGMQSTNYRMLSDSVNIGGGFSSSTNYNLESTVGEVATGESESGTYRLKAGYQQMQEVYIALSGGADVVMSPSISGITGGTSNGSTSVNVLTDSPSGYQLDIKSLTDPAMQKGVDSIDDYVPAGGDPDYTFTVTATDSYFGYSPEGTDIVQRFLNDTVSSCNEPSGSSTAQVCWDGLATTDVTIASGLSANQPSGATTTVHFRVGIGGSVGQEAGTYTATTTITALPL